MRCPKKDYASRARGDILKMLMLTTVRSQKSLGNVISLTATSVKEKKIL